MDGIGANADLLLQPVTLPVATIVAAIWPVSNYAAWWRERGTCVCL